MNDPPLAHTAHALDTDIILAVPRTTAGDLIGMIGIVMTDDTVQGGAHGTEAVVLIDVNARPIATGNKNKKAVCSSSLTLLSLSSRRRRDRSFSPPVPQEERDRRTVFVTQLAQRLKDREFYDFFSQAGQVRDARIITDRITRRSKGYVITASLVIHSSAPFFASVGYVEFREEASVPNALALSGQKLSGIPVQVQLTEAEKNRLALQGQTNA